MSGSEIASLALSAAALVGLIISNIVFARQASEMRSQTKRLQAQLRLSAESALGTTFEGVTRAFLAHPRLRTVFYPDEAPKGGEAPLSHEDELRACSVAEDLLDAFERSGQYASQQYASNALILTSNPFKTYLDDMFRRSDFLYEYLKRRSSWYPPELLDAAERAREANPREMTNHHERET